MINPSDVTKLYHRISHDLLIYKYEGESDGDFHNRLIFSALGKWILTLFKDLDFDFSSIDNEDPKDIFISKSHVTNGAINFCENILKIDPSRSEFLGNKDVFLKEIKNIENIYETFGYVFSGNYNFKRPDYCANLQVGSNCLSINTDIGAYSMQGLGNWLYLSSNYVKLIDFMPCKLNALETFINMIKNLNFELFNDNYGLLQLYDVEIHQRFSYDKSKLDKYDYYILKIDNGFDYKILKKENSRILCASLPNIYKKDNQITMFKHEVWRIILGLCKYCHSPLVCIKSKYTNEGYKFKFKGFTLPFNEYALINLMAWPYKKIDNDFEYVIKLEMVKSFESIMHNLCIEVIKDD